MKLLNKTLLYLSVPLFLIIGIWSIIFYFNMLHEIKSSIDEGLDNYKRQIEVQAKRDTSILRVSNFEEHFYDIREIPKNIAIGRADIYKDTLMYMQDADDESPELEPVRMLSSTFQIRDSYYDIRIINSMVEEDDLVKELLVDTIALYLFLLASILLVFNLILSKLWEPFYSLLNQLKAFKFGKSTSLPQIHTGIKEFNDLEKATQILLLQNMESYEQQKEFIGNASHELQTPLAIAIHKLEFLLESGDFAEQQIEKLAEILEIIERMVRLNKSLLQLSKIENMYADDEQRTVLNPILIHTIKELEELAEYKNIDIQIIENGNCEAHMDENLARMLLSNLCRNALHHNIENGKILIEINEDSLQIKNTGSNKALDPDKIFTRFYKSDASNKGTGLGLAIVKAITDMYDIKTSYTFLENFHSFKLTFRQ